MADDPRLAATKLIDHWPADYDGPRPAYVGVLQGLLAEIERLTQERDARPSWDRLNADPIAGPPRWRTFGRTCPRMFPEVPAADCLCWDCVEIQAFREVDRLSAALQQATQGSAKPSYKGHIDPDCEVARGVGGYCTCETPEEKAEEARERAEIEAALEAESQQATQEQDWQPIETAPKDGTTILIAHAGRIDSSRWVPYAMAHLCEPHIGRWLGEWFREPTHWRPLPLPPAPGGHQP